MPPRFVCMSGLVQPKCIFLTKAQTFHLKLGKPSSCHCFAHDGVDMFGVWSSRGLLLRTFMQKSPVGLTAMLSVSLHTLRAVSLSVCQSVAPLPPSVCLSIWADGGFGTCMMQLQAEEQRSPLKHRKSPYFCIAAPLWLPVCVYISAAQTLCTWSRTGLVFGGWD